MLTWQKGAHSATITWNLRFRAASFRNASTVLERPMVMMTSLEWMCSSACMEMLSVVPSKITGKHLTNYTVKHIQHYKNIHYWTEEQARSSYGFSPSSVSSSLMASMTLALRWAKCCLKLSSLDPPDVSSLCRDSCWSVSSLLPLDLRRDTWSPDDSNCSPKNEKFVIASKHATWSYLNLKATLCNFTPSSGRILFGNHVSCASARMNLMVWGMPMVTYDRLISANVTYNIKTLTIMKGGYLKNMS